MKAKGQLITSMVIFGSIGLFVRGIPLPSSAIAMVRAVLGTCFLAAVLVLGRRKINREGIRKNRVLLLASGAAIGFNWIFLFESYRYTTIARATLSYYLAPVFVILLSPLVLKERLTAKKLGCAVASLIGMAFVAGIFEESGAGSNHLLGIGLGVLAAALYASVILMNRFIRDLSGMEQTLGQLGMGALVLIPYTLLTESGLSWQMPAQAAMLLLILGIVHTGVCYWMYFSSIRELPTQIVAVFSYIDPVVAILLSALFLKEELGIMQAVGAVLILGSAFAGERISD